MWKATQIAVTTATGILAAVAALQSTRNSGAIADLNQKLLQTVEERRFADTVMTRFDNIIVNSAARYDEDGAFLQNGENYVKAEVSANRLVGLHTLAKMLRETSEGGNSDVKNAILKAITAEAERNKERISRYTAIVAGSDLSDDEKRVIVAAADRQSVALESISQQQRPAPVPDKSKPANRSGPEWGGMTLDIFYCVLGNDGQANLDKANSLRSLKSLDPGASGVWRVRPLSASVNAQAGYGSKGYEIRVHGDTEKAFANALVAQAGQIAELRVREVGQVSPNYISVFFCKASPPKVG